MADKEITSQIDKLRKTRPERAVDALTSFMIEGDAPTGVARLDAALSFLHADLKEEARLIELAKLRGGTTLRNDRLVVAGWLELFVIQLRRLAEEPTTPIGRLAPSTELGEHRPSEIGTPAAILPGQGGRCAVGNVHDEHTLKCPCGYTASLVHASQSSPLHDAMSGPSVKDYLSGASDELPTRSEHRCPDCGAVVQHDTSNVACPNCTRMASVVDSLPNGSMAIALDTLVSANAMSERTAQEIIEDALRPLSQSAGILAALSDNPADAEQDLHREIRNGDMTFPTGLDPADPFAPIPAARYSAGPVVPPGGIKWTAADLLAPVMAAAIPTHLSFSQVTTVNDCGAKYRMQRIANLPQVPQWANIGGKAFHAAVEAYEALGVPAGEASGVELLWLKLFNLEIERVEGESGMQRDQFRASNGGKENYDWWRVEGALMLHRYVAWRLTGGAGATLMVRPTPGGGNTPALEWELNYDVDGVPFKTILDSVWIDRSGDTPVAIIRDWKTGSMTPDDRQLCTQAWGLRKAGCPWEVRVQFFDARKGTFTEPFDPFERMSWDDVRYFVLSADAQRRLPILPARPSDFCGGCSVAYACPVMGQRKAPKK